MEIKHVTLGWSEHFLVIDGKRGPVCLYSNRPAMHPAGFFRFRNEAYDIPDYLKGKLFRIVDDVPCEEENVTTCEPAETAFKQYVEIKQTCNEISAGKYEKAEGSAAIGEDAYL